jgi:endonuclease YncB( thermonuclease family)
MNKKLIATTALLVIGVSISGGSIASAAITITKVYDGDTITLSNGEKVRLLQIDTPELSPTECYGKEARSSLVSLLNAPGQLSLKTDPKLDKVDRYGRLLRYVFIGKTNINLKLVEIGAAAPYFYKGDKGRYSTQILKAAQRAKSKSIGLWKSCPSTKLNPTRALVTIGSFKAAEVGFPQQATENCDPNYAGCIPVFPDDVDCTDLKLLGLTPVKVIGIDIHKLDRDGDRIGCDK